MSRTIDYDFNRLLEYFQNYCLKDIILKEDYIKTAKCIHRKLYSFLLLLSELEAQGVLKNPNSTMRMYFKEIGSDLILSFFCWANGAYKPAELQLRSSIENFLKALLLETVPNITLEKSVYAIFDIASNSSVFNNKISFNYYAKLRNEYSVLCASVHSSVDKLSQSEALINFPKYNIKLSDDFSKHFQNVINQMLSISYYSFYDNVFQMHAVNRDLFLQGLLKQDKALIYNYKTSSENQ